MRRLRMPHALARCLVRIGADDRRPRTRPDHWCDPGTPRDLRRVPGFAVRRGQPRPCDGRGDDPRRRGVVGFVRRHDAVHRHRVGKDGGGAMKRVFVASIGALLAMTFAAGEVTATPPTPASGTTWGPNQHVDYRWKEGNEPPAWMRPAINAAVQDSNDSRDSRAAIFSQSDNGSSWISYTGDIPTTYAIGYTVGNLPNSFTMRVRPQGYALDWGTLRWCQFYDTGPTGCYDAEMIALHELGHAQTLDHADDDAVTDWTDTVMHWAPKTKAKVGWNQHVFGRCDIARLQIRYQPLTSSTSISACLDLATDLSFNSSDTTAGYGGSISLSARLTIANDAVWANLASDPLSGRQVTLQRRVPGTSTWTNVTAMPAADDNGRYVKALTVYDTYDYRAVFTAPGNEGLRDQTSSVVRVTVASGGGYCRYTEPDLRLNGEIYVC